MTDEKDPKTDEKPVGAVPPIRRRRVIKSAETGVESPPAPLEPIRVEEKTDGRKLLDARGPRMDFRRRDTRGPRRDDRGRRAGPRDARPRFDDRPKFDEASKSETPREATPRSDTRSALPASGARDDRQRNDRGDASDRRGALGLPVRPNRQDASERAVREEMRGENQTDGAPRRAKGDNAQNAREQSAREPLPEAPAPPVPEPVDIGKELALIAAPPVSVKGPRKEKPKTAKEAMRAKVEAQRSQEQRRRETKNERSGPTSKRPKIDEDGDREPARDDRESSPPSSSQREPARPGLWQRFLGIFRSKK